MIKSVIVAAMLAVAAPALAAADPAAVAAATALVQQIDVKGQIAAGMARAVADMRSGAAITRLLQPQPGFEDARKANPAKFDGVLKKIGALQANAAQKIVDAQTQAVVNAAIQSYATRYTAAELKALADFYRSPLGIAMTTKQPLVAQDIGAANSQIMGAKIQTSMQALGPQIETLLKQLQPTAAAAAPPARKP